MRTVNIFISKIFDNINKIYHHKSLKNACLSNFKLTENEEKSNVDNFALKKCNKNEIFQHRI